MHERALRRRRDRRQLVRVRAGAGPDQIDAIERFPTAEPRETVARIVGFFERHGRPRALGVAGFGPIELDPASASWGTLGATPKPGWTGWPLGPALRDALGVPVVLETDVGAAALGERRWGAGAGCDSLCYLTIGTGIGAGLLLDGAPAARPDAPRGRPHPRFRTTAAVTRSTVPARFTATAGRGSPPGRRSPRAGGWRPIDSPTTIPPGSSRPSTWRSGSSRSC